MLLHEAAKIDGDRSIKCDTQNMIASLWRKEVKFCEVIYDRIENDGCDLNGVARR